MTSHTPRPCSANTRQVRWPLMALGLLLVAPALTLSAALWRPWDQALLAGAAALGCVASAWVGGRLLGGGSRRAQTFAGMLFVLTLTLASACAFDLLGLSFLPTAQTDRLSGALVGTLAALVVLGVLAWRRGTELPRAQAELLAWPLAVATALLVHWSASARWLHDAVAHWPELGLPAEVGWGLAGAAVAYALLLAVLRRRLHAVDSAVGLVLLLTLLLLAMRPDSNGDLVTRGLTVLALAIVLALMWGYFGHESAAWRVAGMVSISFCAVMALSVVPDEFKDLLVMFVAGPLLLASPSAGYLWRRRRRPPFPETPCAVALGTIVMGLLLATSELLVAATLRVAQAESSNAVFFALAVVVSLLPFLLIVSYYFWRRRTLTPIATLLLGLWWVLASLFFFICLLVGMIYVADYTGEQSTLASLAGDWKVFVALALLPPLAALAGQRRAGLLPLPPARAALARLLRATARLLMLALEAFGKGVLALTYLMLIAFLPLGLEATGVPQFAATIAAPELVARHAVLTTMGTTYLWPAQRTLAWDDPSGPVERVDRLKQPNDVLTAVTPAPAEGIFGPMRALPEFGEAMVGEPTDELAANETTVLSGHRVGWLVAGRLTEDEVDGLIPSLRRFYETDVSVLILDLRVSHGGTAYAAQQLAQYFLDRSAAGNVFLRLEFNPQRAPASEMLRFEALGKFDPVLGLQRLIVLTDAQTCGAAELLIHGLRPYLRVDTVGATTCGAPLDTVSIKLPGRQRQRQLFTWVSARGRSADGNPADEIGIVPTCAVAEATSPNSVDLVREAALKLANGQGCPAAQR